MYYFYIVKSPVGRVGFGVSKDPADRNKQYTSHCGALVTMPFLYGGFKNHAQALERIIKQQYINNIWILEDWKTEWLNDNITDIDLNNYVSQLIKERHFRLKLVAKDFDYRKKLDDKDQI